MRIIATDLKNEEEHIFQSGSVIKAMRASTAYPTIITPFFYENRLLVDGGVLNPLPLNRVRRLENDILISIDLGAKIPYHAPHIENSKSSKEELSAYAAAKRTFNKYFTGNSKIDNREKWSYFKLMTQTINVMHNQLNALAVEQHHPDINIPISFRAADTFDFYRAKELVEYGRNQTKIALDHYEDKMQE